MHTKMLMTLQRTVGRSFWGDRALGAREKFERGVGVGRATFSFLLHNTPALCLHTWASTTQATAEEDTLTMELTAQLSENDILVAGGVIVIALIAFIAVLWLSRSDKKKPAAGGSAFVANEDGQVVRRSTRRATERVLRGGGRRWARVQRARHAGGQW